MKYLSLGEGGPAVAGPGDGFILGWGFYKYAAPTALANVAIGVKVSITIFQCGQEVMKV